MNYNETLSSTNTHGRLMHGDVAREMIDVNEVRVIQYTDKDITDFARMFYRLGITSDIGNIPEFMKVTKYLLTKRINPDQASTLSFFLIENFQDAYGVISQIDEQHPVTAVEKYLQAISNYKPETLQ